MVILPSPSLPTPSYSLKFLCKTSLVPNLLNGLKKSLNFIIRSRIVLGPPKSSYGYTMTSFMQNLWWIVQFTLTYIIENKCNGELDITIGKKILFTFFSPFWPIFLLLNIPYIFLTFSFFLFFYDIYKGKLDKSYRFCTGGWHGMSTWRFWWDQVLYKPTW